MYLGPRLSARAARLSASVVIKMVEGVHMISTESASSEKSIVRPRKVPYWCLLAGLFAWITGTLSCTSPNDKDDPRSNRGRTQAMLAAAHSRDINMFGEIGGSRVSNYFPRSTISLRQHSFTEVGADEDPDLDSTGKEIVFASTRHNVRPDLYIKSVDGVAVTQLTSDPGSDVQPAFDPSNRRVAFASDRAGTWDIWIVSVDGGQAVQVTQGLAEDVHPSWSPDGTKLVYCSLPPGSGQWELWIVDVGAGSSRKFIGYGLFPEWSPSGNTILYQRARERGGRWFGIWTLTLVDGEPRYPTELAWDPQVAFTLPTWSPDGTWIAFVAVRTRASSNGSQVVTGPSDLWVMTADGRGRVRLTDGFAASTAPTYAPDGRIFFVSDRTGHKNIWSLTPFLDSVTTLEDNRTARAFWEEGS